MTIFTCGPSIYQRAHIGNFRTFLFEDILVRYLEYRGWRVSRGMNVTDIEDKAITEARKDEITVKELTDENIDGFLREMRLLRIKTPGLSAPGLGLRRRGRRDDRTTPGDQGRLLAQGATSTSIPGSSPGSASSTGWT